MTLKQLGGAALLLILIGVAGTRVSGQQQSQADCGRYRLYQLEYNSFTDNSSFKEQRVFRLDTQTGETLVYLSSTSRETGVATNAWVKIDSPK